MNTMSRRGVPAFVSIGLIACAGCAPEDHRGGVPEATSVSGLTAPAREGEHSGTTPVSVQWSEDLADKRGASSARVRVTSNLPKTALVGIKLRSSGLAGRIVVRDLDSVTLQPGESVEIDVQASALPLKAALTTSQLQVVAVVDAGAHFEIPSGDVLYHFEQDGLETVSFYDTATVLRRFGGRTLVAHGATRSVRIDGRELARDADKLAVMQATGKQVFVADGESGLEVVEAGDAPPRGAVGEKTGLVSPVPSAPLAPAYVSVCGRWSVNFVDPTVGSWVPASFASGSVVRASDSAVMWSGTLSSGGCSPELALPVGEDYTFKATTYLKDETDLGFPYGVVGSGAIVDIYRVIRFMGLPLNLRTTASQTFNINTGMSNVHMSMLTYPALSDDNVHVAAAVGQAVARTDNGLLAETYKLRTQTWCGAPPDGTGTPPAAGESCCNGSGCFIGSGPYGGVSEARWQYIVLHEFGHAVQDLAMGLPGGGTSSPYGHAVSQPLCRCDHVSLPSSDSLNRYHCMQSREYSFAAQTEGFGHLIAARATNDTAASSCSFAYYKEFMQPGGAVMLPPVAIDCASNPRWMETQCYAGGSTGVEWDWLNFLYAVTKSVPNRTSMTSLAKIYKRACTGTTTSKCGWSDAPTYASLQAAAGVEYGLDSPKYNLFRQTATAKGVNN